MEETGVGGGTVFAATFSQRKLGSLQLSLASPLKDFELQEFYAGTFFVVCETTTFHNQLLPFIKKERKKEGESRKIADTTTCYFLLTVIFLCIGKPNLRLRKC